MSKVDAAVKNAPNRSSRSLFKRTVSIAVGLGVVVLALVWIRAFFESRRAYQQGEGYKTEQQYVKAVTFFDRSIHWYAPFNPYVQKSAERLWEIGALAEKQGDIPLALIAIRTIRRGFLAARSFYTPGRDWIHKCDAKIASLMNHDLPAQVSLSPQASSEPNVFWTLILEVGLIGWIGSAIGFLMLSVRGGDMVRLKSGAAVFWGTMIVAFYAMWIVGMIRA